MTLMVLLVLLVTPVLFLTLTEPDQHDVREDVASTETLLQTEHHQEGAGTKAAVQVAHRSAPTCSSLRGTGPLTVVLLCAAGS